MADPTTVNIALAVPLHGSNVDTWDVPLNADFTSIDGFMAGVQTISVSGGALTLSAPTGTITPSAGPTQSQNAIIRFTGALTSSAQITLPLPGRVIIENLTTGNFVVTFRAVGAGEIIAIDQGSQQNIYNDGTNVRFVGLPPVGSYLDLADATVPAWITSCTKPPYLLCNGTTFSAVTYPYLNTKLGTTTLPDFRGRTGFYLNDGTGRLTTAGAGIDGNTRFASGGVNGIVLTSPTQLPAHTHNNTLNDPGHAHSYTQPALGGNNGGGAAIIASTAGGITNLNTTSITISNASVGAGANIPNSPPGVVSGIRLIRAG